MPEITVLMAVHNDERYIEKATVSILHQTFRDFEFLVIDDASKDNTKDIINSFADPRIKILTNRKSIGLTRSLNMGLQRAQGQYIARMDGDDVSYPARLEKQIAFLKSNPACGLVGTGYQTIDEQGWPLDEGRIYDADLDLKEALKVTNQFAHSSVMFPKKVITTVGAYRDIFRFAQDYDLFLRISEKFAVALIPEIMLERRLCLDSASLKHKILQDRFAQMARECAKQRNESGSDFVDKVGEELSENDALNVIRRSLSNLEKYSMMAENYFSWALYFKNNSNGHAHRTGYTIKLLIKSLLANPRVFLGLACGHLIHLIGRLVSPKR